jgi:formylglycine-generating enzyme
VLEKLFSIKMMKSFKICAGILVFITILSSCGSSSKQNGQLTGVMNRPQFKGINPYGMVYVPSGQVHIGQSDQDIFSTYLQTKKSISLVGFYMDDTEITNNEYRQFVESVRDSIAHTLMGDIIENEDGTSSIDWELELDYSDPTLDELFYQGDNAIAGREFDNSKLEYVYKERDWKAEAANPKALRKNLIKTHKVKIHPDELCWIRDFSYSYNEPYTRNYFSHPAFDDYPVVGVTWHQANAFCNWRTNLYNKYKDPKEMQTESFRLPTELEWEYAARGGRDLAPYPWGGYYVRNAKGCLIANFKPGRGNYPEDGGLYTVKADEYFPNDYGLYCMAGNVAEWTGDAFDENSYSRMHDLNPTNKYDAKDTDPDAKKRKSVRGGSWKDISHYLQTGSRNWEYQDTSKSYIGFRCVLTFLGRTPNDFK